MYFEGYGCYDPSMVGQNSAGLNMAELNSQQPGLIQRMKEGREERKTPPQ